MFTRVKINEIFEYKCEGTIKHRIPKLDIDLLKDILKEAEKACEEYLFDFSNGWNTECEDTFPCTHCLNKEYYVEHISIYGSLKEGIVLSLMLHFLENLPNGKTEDYLGMEVYFELDSEGHFYFTGDIDTSSI